jgi:anaphase-promoting complex subunit 11
MVACWTWKGIDEMCGICHTELDGCAPEALYPGDDSPVVWGTCSHAFHLSCIDQWCRNQPDAPTCPMCRRPWEIAGDETQQAQQQQQQQQEQDENVFSEFYDEDEASFNNVSMESIDEDESGRRITRPI